MKRILISLVTSGCFIIFYTSTALILEMLRILTSETTDKLAIPFRLPSYIYYDVLHLQINDENLAESIIWVCSAILINLVLYAFLAYLLLMLIFGKTKESEISPQPPEPPVFQDIE